MDVLYYNSALFNIRHISVTGRHPLRFRPGTIARRLRFYQETGSGVSLQRIVVCRRPIIAFGDSFVAGYAGGPILANVGRALATQHLFTRDQYVINAGISGNPVLVSVEASTAARLRWNSSRHDLCAYHDVVVLFVNGPGLNDVACITALNTPEQVSARAGELASAITQMAQEAFTDGDEVGGRNLPVMCELIPYTAYRESDYNRYLNQKNCIEELNFLLGQFAAANGIPFVQVYDEMPEAYSDGTHPTAQGSTWIAERIVQAYESAP
jgi:lysophospholipase L1-like esterase